MDLGSRLSGRRRPPPGRDRGRFPAVWSPADGRTLRQVTLPRGLLRFAVDPGGRQVAAADMTGTVRILTLPDLQVIATLEGPREAGWACPAFSGDGRWLAVGGSDRRATLYDARTFQKLLVLPPQNSLEFRSRLPGEWSPARHERRRS